MRYLALLFVFCCWAQDEPALAPKLYQSVTVKSRIVEPDIDHRNSEVFDKTLFSRDDQIFHLLDAGIDAGQHEGGGKSVEIRRFGFNLDHGGVNGGLDVLIDGVQQNQATQAHGQGYLGSLKSLSPELVQEVNVINGPFSAEYGDFSGLGVVHIHLRDAMPDEWTARVEGGSFDTGRGFLAWSPSLKNADAFVAYEGAYTDGPFIDPLRYRRDNLTGNYMRHLSPRSSFAVRFNGGLNRFHSSGQLPLDEVVARRLDRFGFIDPSDGGRVHSGTLALYYREENQRGASWTVNGSLGRSLFDLYSDFTFFLRDPVHGDAIQQHDSRLQEGASAQYTRPHRFRDITGQFTAGANLSDNQIALGLYPVVGRVPIAVTPQAHAVVANGAGYLQETESLWHGKLVIGGGLRYDIFHFGVAGSDAQLDSALQPKANLALTPSNRIPVTLYLNYGRGISSMDARGVVEQPHSTHLAKTDFYQLGTSHKFNRFAFTTDLFLINRSNELVYNADDGSLDFQGRSRSYGFEAKTSAQLTHSLSLNAGITKVGNAYYVGGSTRLYVEAAPHFVASAGLTLSAWHGWSGSLRMRAINHYRLDEAGPAVVAAGHTVWDLNLARKIRRGVEFNLAIDNLTNRAYYETQNYFESQLPAESPLWRIHGTPGYPATITAGLTFRFKGK